MDLLFAKWKGFYAKWLLLGRPRARSDVLELLATWNASLASVLARNT
jgi:hypothetical protein